MDHLLKLAYLLIQAFAWVYLIALIGWGLLISSLYLAKLATSSITFHRNRGDRP